MPSLGSYLQPVIGDIGNMKDYAHASRLYADNVFSLAPKAGWMYYVVFDIDPSTITDSTWANKQKVTEVGMLVKSADLPKFTVQTEVVNQYNRKTVIQKGMTYNPINITMHDDQSNVVHNMWLNYYRYYFADSTWGGTGPIGTEQDNTPGAYQNNKYLPSNDLFNPVNYGLNSQLVVAPFFRSVTIYQLNRKAFTSFKLVNPIVQSWDHDKLDQTQGGRLAESRMGLNYEAVFYGQGVIKKDTPTGFAIFHYDTSPSPLSIAGGGNNSIFGPGGVIPGALDIFGNIENVGTTGNPLSALGVALKGVNLVRNVKNITANSLRSEGYAILNNALQKAGQGGLNGLGVNLNLNKGNNYATAGQFLGTPVAVVQDSLAAFGGGPVQTQSPSSNGTAPGSSNSSVLGAAAAAMFASQKATINKILPSGSSTDTTPSGDTPAAGQYFPPPQPLSDTAPFTTSVDENSSPADIQSSLSALNAAWASDNAYVNSQAPDPSSVSDRLAAATSDQEKAAIQANADSAYNSTQSIQSTVDAKYQTEYARLTGLLNSAQTNTSGSNATQSTPDASSNTPSPESDAVPPPNEDI
jgi:hypothetical protein